MATIRSRGMFLRTAILGIALPLVAVPAWADRTFYVAKHGADGNPGTEAQPWLTIAKAADTLVAGDTVYIQAGTYCEQVVPKNSGTPSRFITYAAYPGHEVTLDGTGIVVGWPWGLFKVKDQSGIKLSGIRIENSTWFGVSVSGKGSHIVLENNRMRHCQACGIHVASEKGARTVTDVVIAGNEVTLTNFNGSDEGISLCGIERFEVRDNHVHHIHKEGIDTKVGCAHGKVHRNYVHHLLGINRPKKNNPIACRVGIYVDTWGHTHDIEVSGNIVHNCATGFAIASETGNPCENIRFVNNLSYQNEVGFALGWEKTGPKNIAFINNIAYANQGKGIFISCRNVENVVVRNNIVSRNGDAQVFVPDPMEHIVVDHNLIDGYRGLKWSSKGGLAWKEIEGDNVVHGNPKFFNPVGGDFRLSPDSPAIDKGSAVDAPSTDFDGNRRPQGTAVDLGAFEFDPAAPPSSPGAK